MRNQIKSPAKLKSYLADEAQGLGFDLFKITRAGLPEEAGNRLKQFVGEGHHGTMSWLANNLDRRSQPQVLWPDARSVIMLGMNYGPNSDPLADLEKTSCGNISVYARNRDYHDLIKGKLKELAGKLAARSGGEVKVFVDTAPVMEKVLADQSGLGWQGKHTNLVSPKLGSWFFLGAIFTSVELPADSAASDHCGSCRSCLDICPTNAFPAPYRLDARRCISYLTIEHKGPIPVEFRSKMGNRIFGCDDCLAVCPWNKFAQQSRQLKLQAREELLSPELRKLASFDDAEFRNFFSGSPVKRIGRNRFLRNVLIAIGNSGDISLRAAARPHIDDADPVVVESAEWALSRLAGPKENANS